MILSHIRPKLSVGLSSRHLVYLRLKPKLFELILAVKDVDKIAIAQVSNRLGAVHKLR